MRPEGADMSDRVVLGRRTDTFAGFEWTGAEPEGMNDPSVAETLGAQWEGEELVTYELDELRHTFEHYGDDWLPDSD